MKLEARQLDQLEAPERYSRIYYDGRSGLGLRVTAARARSWILNYTNQAGKRHRCTLGRYPNMSLPQARALASTWREKIETGVVERDAQTHAERRVWLDPLEEAHRERERARIEARAREEQAQQGREHTLTRLIELWLAAHGTPNRRASTQASDESIFRCHLRPRFGNRTVADLTQAEVKNMMAEMKAAKIPTQANRTLALLTTLMRYAVELGWRSDNPCAKVKRHPEHPRSVRVARADLDRLFTAIEEHPHRQPANAIKLLVWTGARRGEVLGAEWSEFDLERRLWIRPPERVKQKRRSVLPLNDLALNLLREMRRRDPRGEVLFPSDASAGGTLRSIERFWQSARKAAGLGGLRIHDLRHIFATSALESGAPLDIIAPLLGHSSTIMTRVYAEWSAERLQIATQAAAQRLALPAPKVKRPRAARLRVA